MAEKVALTATRSLTADDVYSVCARLAPVVIEDAAISRVRFVVKLLAGHSVRTASDASNTQTPSSHACSSMLQLSLMLAM